MDFILLFPVYYNQFNSSPQAHYVGKTFSFKIPEGQLYSFGELQSE